MEAALDDLYGATQSDFVATRKRLVAELRARARHTRARAGGGGRRRCSRPAVRARRRGRSTNSPGPRSRARRRFPGSTASCWAAQTQALSGRSDAWHDRQGAPGCPDGSRRRRARLPRRASRNPGFAARSCRRCTRRACRTQSGISCGAVGLTSESRLPAFPTPSVSRSCRARPNRSPIGAADRGTGRPPKSRAPLGAGREPKAEAVERRREQQREQAAEEVKPGATPDLAAGEGGEAAGGVGGRGCRASAGEGRRLQTELDAATQAFASRRTEPGRRGSRRARTLSRRPHRPAWRPHHGCHAGWALGDIL